LSVTVEYSTDGGSSWTSINVSDWNIEYGLTQSFFAPTGKIKFDKSVSIPAESLVRIYVDGVKRLEGQSLSAGTLEGDGNKSIKIQNYGYDIMEEDVSISLTGVYPEDVIGAVLDKVSPSGYSSSNLTTINSPSISSTIDYENEDKAKKIIREMCSRAGYVLKIGPDKDFTFEPSEYNDYGTITDYNVEEYTEDDIQTVVNKVEVVGTGGESPVRATASDFSYVDRVKKRKYNVSYISTSGEASNLANKRLKPEPNDTGKLLVGGSDYTSANITNQTVSFDLSYLNLGTVTALITHQKISEGGMVLTVGVGSDFGREEQNKGRYSDEDKAEEGADNTDKVLDERNIEDNATFNDIFTQDSVPSGSDGDMWYDTGSHVWYVCTQSSCSTLSDWTEASDITSYQNQSFSWLTDTIQKTQISNDTIETPMLEANIINSDYVDTLYLDASQDVRLGVGNSDYIGFVDGYTYDGTDLGTSMNPSSNNTCSVGSDSKAFKEGFFYNFHVYNELIAETITTTTNISAGGDVSSIGKVSGNKGDFSTYLKVPVGEDQYPT